jgi:malate dehydrogenase (oxaloacetate-decarboxylating)
MKQLTRPLRPLCPTGTQLVPHFGAGLLERPLLNKDTGFDDRERDAFGLRGLLPSRVETLEEQVSLELEHLRRKNDDLERYIGLSSLQDRNETLFYRVLMDNLEELMPIVYTPTVGRACQTFSHIMRRPRGLWITPADRERIPTLLRNARPEASSTGVGKEDVRLIVATDNERILGLGDQGAGGMGIPIGKLALYTAGAGIYPAYTLPISLDVGTDNEELLADPLYVGYRKRRLRGTEYDEFLEAFVDAILDVFPRAVLQWEDFKQHNAIRVLDRYRRRITSFNDDIQGTGAVVLAGVLAAIRALQRPIGEQRFVFLGSGAAGIGIARLARAQLMADGRSLEDAKRALVMVDSKGLVFEGRAGLELDKGEFALTPAEAASYGLDLTSSAAPDLEAVVAAVKPTMLIGTSGTPGAFTEKTIRTMAEHVERPVVFPLSNPTAKSEAQPADVMAWTGGRALVATGSPFPTVRHDGRELLIGQANNVFIFPGMGLGAIVAEAREITDEMFLLAARTLAEMVPPDRLAAGALYPAVAELRHVSREIAAKVVCQSRDCGVGRLWHDEEVYEAVDAAMWKPGYLPYEPSGRTKA